MPKSKSKGPLSIKGIPEELTIKARRRVGAHPSRRRVRGPPLTSHALTPAAIRPQAALGDDASVRLCATARPINEDGTSLPAGLDFATAAPLASLLAGGVTSAFLQLDPRSDCVLACRHDPQVPEGTMLVDVVQRHNLHMLPGESYSFRVFDPHAADEAGAGVLDLVELEAEVRLWEFGSSTATMTGLETAGSWVDVDAQRLVAQLKRSYFGRIVAVNEYLLLRHPGVEAHLLVRIAATNNLSAEEQDEAVGYHCFRGRLTPDTSVHLHSTPAPSTSSANATNPDAAKGSSSVQSRVAGTGSRRIRLVGAAERVSRPPPTSKVRVLTNDGEVFSVNKNLLRPCIALTKAVRDKGVASPEVSMDVDTATFDRVLLFLEASALGKPPPGFALHLLDDLAQAARVLGLRALDEHCVSRLGARASALAVYSLADVRRANAEGRAWLLLDGMVLDVTRWLPEHPGGSTIIPDQALDCDCARFFEMYHASRESFMYLKEFYIGELLPVDRGAAIVAGSEVPSVDFLAQLREYTQFRMGAEQVAVASAGMGAFKSF